MRSLSSGTSVVATAVFPSGTRRRRRQRGGGLGGTADVAVAAGGGGTPQYESPSPSTDRGRGGRKEAHTPPRCLWPRGGPHARPLLAGPCRSEVGRATGGGMRRGCRENATAASTRTHRRGGRGWQWGWPEQGVQVVMGVLGTERRDDGRDAPKQRVTQPPAVALTLRGGCTGVEDAPARVEHPQPTTSHARVCSRGSVHSLCTRRATAHRRYRCPLHATARLPKQGRAQVSARGSGDARPSRPPAPVVR